MTLTCVLHSYCTCNTGQTHLHTVALVVAVVVVVVAAAAAAAALHSVSEKQR